MFFHLFYTFGISILKSLNKFVQKFWANLFHFRIFVHYQPKAIFINGINFYFCGTQ